VNQYQAIIVICRAVIRVAFADAAKSPLNVIIGDIVFFPQVPIIQAQLAETHTANGCGSFIVGYMLRVVYVFFVYALEFQLSKSEHY
jgi:hypothetical protein